MYSGHGLNLFHDVVALGALEIISSWHYIGISLIALAGTPLQQA
jgi:hypothetical protein